MLIYQNKLIEGFANKVSVSRGEKIEFKISSESPFSLGVRKIQDTNNLFYLSDVQGKIQEINKNPFLGVNWETSFTLDIPEKWLSGLYIVELNNSDSKAYIFFIVKGTKETKSQVAVLASTHTWQAYNFWGGACFYDIYNVKQTQIISYNRPLMSRIPDIIDVLIKEKPFGKRHIMNCERILYKWLSERYSFDVIAEPDLIDVFNYKVLIIGCHSEYWTEKMYNLLVNFLGSGRKVIYLGGNAMYWKVYDKSPFLKCDKENHETWRRLNRPESAVLGVQYTDTDYKTFAPYQLRANKHWAFENTGLKQGDTFGKNASGWETDKTSLFTPEDTTLLAKGQNKDGGAEMVCRDNVFSASSLTYTLALNDPIISQITKNVFDRFLSN